MSKRLYEIHADICKALGNAKRIEIINALDNRELTVGKLAEILDISQANVSQHLAIMKQKGILTTRKTGANIYYKVSNPKVNQACNLMREVLLEQLNKGKEIAREFSKR